MPLPTGVLPTGILLIEPAGTLASHLQDALRSEFPSSGDIALARSWREALAHLTRQRVDLVLMDMTLPDYGGVDAVRALRATAPYCPLVTVSAAADEGPLLDALGAGAHEVLSAPVSRPVLRAAVARAIRRADHSRSAAASPPSSPDLIVRPAARLIHDLNNAMTSINGFADMLLARTPAGDPARAAAEQIRSAGSRAAALVQALAQATDPLPASRSPLRHSALIARPIDSQAIPD